MLDALIPYIPEPELTLTDVPVVGKLQLKTFGPLVVAGLLVGRNRCREYARRKDLDLELFHQYLLWMLIIAFAISHWVSALLYFPHEVAKRPWVMLQIWNGLSSVGGFFGAFVGGVFFLRVYCARRPIGAQPVLVFSDISVFGLLAGWCFGRAACSLVHDHPGRVVAEGTLLAVGPWPDGTWRYDLGLIELMFAIALMLLVYLVLRWDQWPPGRLTGLALTAYAPFRFFLDYLRTDTAVRGVLPIPDERYLGLTPAQWFTMLFLAMGLWLLVWRKPSEDDLRYARQSDRVRNEPQAKPADARPPAEESIN
ncbi:prolipoprotein diacylglyceryl transferase [Paraliomyxa miuraensis]|uniref:prolipoprotein diacylglyceryl transferase n=1 Tax=Paraliomyxa miuraensis TaxID=376150 RepID=UPI00224DB3B9|nr:prolipoprotein diacylglyceryl transferase family protein [Paraliomyxa miuraensis]MCX4244974.1 prolipoprotein diacylglyceryl transferase [Paraliomyxa miuraensis]